MLCDDKTVITSNERILYKTEGCRLEESNKKRLKDSGLSGKELLETFECARKDKYNQKVFDWLQKDWSISQSLYIYGKHGTGKSYAANAVAHMLLKKGLNVIVVRELDMTTRIQQTFSDETGEQERRFVAKFKKTKVLVIQDIGKYGLRKGSEWWPAQLFDIIDSRVIAGLCTIFTSNYTLDDLLGRLGNNHGPAIYSRLSGTCVQILLPGPDRRQIKSAQD